MPGEKPGYNPGDQKDDQIDDYDREPTPEEQERAKELAQARMDRLAQRAEERKSLKEKPAVKTEAVSSPFETPAEAPKLGKIQDNRSKLSLGTSISRRKEEARQHGGATGRSEEGQETDHNREIKDILKKFVFSGSFKLRTSQEKGKYLLRVLSGVEGDKNTRVVLKVEGTMEDIKTKLEKHLDHNYTRK